MTKIKDTTAGQKFRQLSENQEKIRTKKMSKIEIKQIAMLQCQIDIKLWQY